MGRRPGTHRRRRNRCRQNAPHRIDEMARICQVGYLGRRTTRILPRQQVLPQHRRNGALQLILRQHQEISNHRGRQRHLEDGRQQVVRSIYQPRRRSTMGYDNRHCRHRYASAHRLRSRHSRRLRRLLGRLRRLQNSTRAAQTGRQNHAQLHMAVGCDRQ